MEPLIPGGGSHSAVVAIVADAPSGDDVKQNRILAGGPGKVFWALHSMTTGLRREQTWTTSFWPWELTQKQHNKGLDEGEMAIGGALLEDELSKLPNLRVVVAAGKHAAAHLLQRPAARMDHLHGLTFEVGDRLVFPMFLPSFRDSKRLAFTKDDLDRLSRVLAGQELPWRERTVAPKYGLWTPEGMAEVATAREVSIDTEYDGLKPLMVTFTVTPGTGYAIMPEDTKGLTLFRDGLAKARPLVIFHNALADLEQLKRLKPQIDIVGMGLDIRDTMARAWYMETEPQGLKPLAYRHLGVDRSGFEDIVAPYFESALLNYIGGVHHLTAPKQLRGKKGQLIKKWETSTPLRAKTQRWMLDAEAGRITDMEKRWKTWQKEEPGLMDEAVALLGPPPRFSLAGVPPEIAIPYACSDTDDTLQLFHKIPPHNLELERKDMAKLPMIAAMQERGMRVNLVKYEELRAEVEDELASQLATLRALVGRDDFNPGSPDDIAEALFGIHYVDGIAEFMKDKEYLVPPAWTKSKRAKTNKQALGMLRDESEIPGMLLVYKELEKLASAYIRPLPRLLRYESGFPTLHPNFRHTRVPSGRLAAVNPNIMAIPSRSKLGLKFRALFEARPGYKYVAFDHSQIELRLAAEISKDQVMLDLFYAGVDLHLGTAAKILGKSITDPWWTTTEGKITRALFKQINFGILYGATASRIYLELLAMGVRLFTLEQVEEMVKNWFELYTGIAEEIRATAAFMQQHGYVEDIWGRRRKLPGAMLYGRFWPMSFLREEAIRQGFNLKIQGGAQGLLINAMIGFWTEDLPGFRELGFEAHPILQVHDELDFEVEDRDDSIAIFSALGLSRMVLDQPLFQVPIEASSSEALDWSGLK